MKKRFLSIVAVALIFSMIVGSVSVSALTNQEKLDSINQQISSAKNRLDASQRQANSLTDKINRLDQQIISTQNSINEIQAEIDRILADIEAKKKELDVKSEQIAKQNEDLGDRLCAMYKNGEVSYIEIILGSKSFSEFLNNIDMITKIYKQDEDFMTLLQKQYDSIADTKKELEELNAQLQEKRTQLQNKQQSLENDKATAQQLRQQAEADVAAQNQLIDGLNQSAQQITFLIQEEQRKAAEEAARRAAELAAGAKRSASKVKLGSSTPTYIYGASTDVISTSSMGGSYLLPAPSYVRISSYYGYRIHPITKTSKLHTGIDFAAPYGTSCVASQSGTVIYSGWYSGYGNTVVIDHGDGISTLYGHNSALLVTKGQSVTKGQEIAKIGSTGNSTGPHCHFEVRINGQHTNPMPYLNGSN